MYDKKNREQLGRIVDQINQILSKAEREKRDGLNSSERETWNRLADEHSRIEKEIQRNERNNPNNGLSLNGGESIEELRDSFRLTNGGFRERQRDPHARAFSAYLRNGLEAMDSDDRQVIRAKFLNAQSSGTATQGGALIPQGFSGSLAEAMKWFGGIEGTVDTFTTGTGNPLPWPTTNDTTNRGRIIGQNVQVTETDIVFGQVTFNAYIFSSDIVLVPLSLVEDSYFDIDALVARLLGTRLGRLYNWKMTTGAGVNSGEPNGIVTAATAAGNIYTCPTGETTSIVYNDLVNLEHSVDPAYRNNPASKWMFSDAVLKMLKKLVDGNNRPLWQPGLTASFEQGAGVDVAVSNPKILDHGYVINQDMASPAANAYTVLFGDMSTYKVRKVANGSTVLRLVERYADYLQLGYIGYERADGQLVDAGTHPIAVLQQSAT